MRHPTIHPAIMDDYDVICTLLKTSDDHHIALLPDYFQNHSGPPRPRAWVAAFIESDDADILLAHVGTHAVGCLILKTISLPDYPRFLSRSMAHVEEIVVAPDHRRTGIATALMNHAKTWATQRGLNRIQLGVWTANTPALRFYQEQGFKPITTRMELNLQP